MTEQKPENATPSIRYQDKCAWCGHELAVVSRSWEGVSSHAARVVCANYCSDENGCGHPSCPKNCNIRADLEPARVITEIQRRQQILRRENERREEAHRARSK